MEGEFYRRIRGGLLSYAKFVRVSSEKMKPSIPKNIQSIAAGPAAPILFRRRSFFRKVDLVSMLRATNFVRALSSAVAGHRKGVRQRIELAGGV